MPPGSSTLAPGALVNLPSRAKRGEIIEVKTLIAHPMETGYRLDNTGGAIPLVKAMSDGVPDAAIFVFGATDSFANIHGPNERLLLDEWEKAVLAETRFFEELATRAKGAAR